MNLQILSVLLCYSCTIRWTIKLPRQTKTQYQKADGENNEKWNPYSYLGTMLTNGSSSLAVPFSSDHVVYLAVAPASAAPSNFSSPPSLRQVGRSQIICRLVSHFKVKQQLRSQLFRRGIFRPYSGELEIEQNYGMDWPLTSSPIYLHNNCPDHLGNTSAGRHPAVP